MAAKRSMLPRFAGRGFRMKRSIVFGVSTFVLALSGAMIGGAMIGVAPGAEVLQVDLTDWSPPKLSTLGNDPFSKLVKYGHALVTDTPNQIGPDVADPAKRLSGNNLTCQNCHLQAGTQPYAMPLTGVWGQFPQYRGREGEVGTLEDRINGCMDRSMNGKALALNSTEMKAYLAYMKWLSTGIADGAKLKGSGTLATKAPDRAVDLAHGEQVYAQTCALCHGNDGLGKRAATGHGYQFPPLWGPDSYNDGAGMGRVLTAAAFAQHNMPLGTTFESPVLNDADAYDVSGYINSKERPVKADLAKDFPNRLQKSADTPYGPYVDGFDQHQHKFGPFGPIRAKIRELQEAAAAAAKAGASK
jgi:thiosulfate dehydrogenase